MTQWPIIAVAAALVATAPLSAQSVLERSPNLQGTWGAGRSEAVFVLAHRFEFLSGGDELFSVPTLTLAYGLPLGITLGLDYTSFSEVVPENATGNETQYWLKRPLPLGAMGEAALQVAYNSAASSVDGALNLRVVTRRVQLFGEGRVFSDLYGTGDAAGGGGVGAALRLTEFLSVTGDLGKVLTEEGIPAAWSGAVALAIPASPHTLSLQVTNTGATTLQGASRKKTLGSSSVRYGFTFTVPFGGRGRWGRIFDPLRGEPPAEISVADARIRMRHVAPVPDQVRPGSADR